MLSKLHVFLQNGRVYRGIPFVTAGPEGCAAAYLQRWKICQARFSLFMTMESLQSVLSIVYDGRVICCYVVTGGKECQRLIWKQEIW